MMKSSMKSPILPRSAVRIGANPTPRWHRSCIDVEFNRRCVLYIKYKLYILYYILVHLCACVRKIEKHARQNARSAVFPDIPLLILLPQQQSKWVEHKSWTSTSPCCASRKSSRRTISGRQPLAMARPLSAVTNSALISCVVCVLERNRNYAQRKIRDDFRCSKSLTDAEVVKQSFAFAQKSLEMIKRQVGLPYFSRLLLFGC